VGGYIERLAADICVIDIVATLQMLVMPAADGLNSPFIDRIEE